MSRPPKKGQGDAPPTVEIPEEAVPSVVSTVSTESSQRVPVGPCATFVAPGVAEEPFGKFRHPHTGEEQEAKVFTLTTSRKMRVRITNYGASVVSIRMPDNKDVVKDIILGFDNVRAYKRYQKHMLGGIVGRVAGRIPWARFILDGAIYNITSNARNYQHHDNGGYNGFQQLPWEYYVPSEGGSLVFSLVSWHEDEGFPASVLVQVRYRMTAENVLLVDMRANSTAPTPINLRQGLMFNLAGHAAGPEKLSAHLLTLNADYYLPTTAKLTATGTIQDVRRAPCLDYRVPRRLKFFCRKTTIHGYEHNFVVNNIPDGALRFVARLEHPDTGRVVEIQSNQPVVHVYTGRKLPKKPVPKKEEEEQEQLESLSQTGADDVIMGMKVEEERSEYPTLQPQQPLAPEESELFVFTMHESQETKLGAEGSSTEVVIGKNDLNYWRHGGIWLAPTWYPHAINMEEVPRCDLTPEKEYRHITAFRFFTAKKPKRYYYAEEIVSETMDLALETVDNRPPEEEKPEGEEEAQAEEA